MITINKFAKTSILSALLMGSAAVYATKPITNVNTAPKQNQTEVLSKSGAEALRAVSLQGVTQASVPSVHNQKLDNNFKKFADNDENLKQINDIIKVIYDNCGTFLASAQIQHELDRQQLFLLLNKNTDLLAKVNPDLAAKVKEIGPNFYKGVNDYGKVAEKWLNEDYTPVILNLLSFDHKPTARELSRKLDDIAENRIDFNEDELMQYRLRIGKFERNVINDKTDNMSLSSLIAYKMFIIDKMMFEKTLDNCNFFNEYNFFDKYTGLKSYYDKWMDSVSPNNK